MSPILMFTVPIFPALCCIEIHIFQASSHFRVGFSDEISTAHSDIFPLFVSFSHVWQTRPYYWNDYYVIATKILLSDKIYEVQTLLHLLYVLAFTNYRWELRQPDYRLLALMIGYRSLNYTDHIFLHHGYSFLLLNCQCQMWKLTLSGLRSAQSCDCDTSCSLLLIFVDFVEYDAIAKNHHPSILKCFITEQISWSNQNKLSVRNIKAKAHLFTLKRNCLQLLLLYKHALCMLVI